MQKILITGGSGFLGAKLVSKLSTKFQTHGTCLRHFQPNLVPLNVTKKTEVEDKLRNIRPDIVIHTVALSDPDYCEEHKAEAEEVNVLGTENVAKACQLIKAKLIHISTASIFDGTAAPYREDALPTPISVYGETKVAAEEIVRKLAESAILRFDFLYGYNGPDSPNGLVGKILNRKKIEANPVQIRRPLLVDDVADTIQRIIEASGVGIFHLSGPDMITKHLLCKRLEETLGVTGDVYPIEATAQKARRASDTSLLTGRLTELGMRFTPIEAALAIIRGQYFQK